MFILRLISSRMPFVFVTVTPRYLNFPHLYLVYCICIIIFQMRVGCDRINMGNACYYSHEKIFSSRLLSKKVKTYKNIILPVVLYGCETWSLTLREDHRLRCSKIKHLRTKKDQITQNGECYTMLSYMHCILRLT